MPQIRPVSAGNRLLAAIPRNDCLRFLAGCEEVELGFSEVLAEFGQRIPHVYFPVASIVSLIAPTNGGGTQEVGLIGDEGMLGVTLILGVERCPLHALVQGEGPALRMDRASFLREFGLSPALQRLLKRYLYVMMGQLAQAVVCSHVHVLEARLARWILMTRDRAHSDSFHITHEFLSQMLGVRRVGVTKAASSLQGRSLIRYKRGNIKVIDASGLQAAACGCYATDKARYESVLGPDLGGRGKSRNRGETTRAGRLDEAASDASEDCLAK